MKNETANNKNNASHKPSTKKSVEELLQEINKLALTIDKVEDEKAEIENQFKKALADYVNLERSIENRLNIQLAHLKKKVASELIDIMDNVKLAQSAADKMQFDAATQSWVEGVISTLSKMEKALGELGIEIIDVNAGDPFDSMIHEAIATVPGDQDNTIFEVIQPGYKMGDQIVRAAKVVVTKT